MPLGGFAPLPLRLGGPATHGVSAEQWCRLAADVLAAKRGAPFAWLTYDMTGGLPTVESYQALPSSGVTAAPIPIVGGTGDVLWSWPDGALDAYDVAAPIVLRHGVATTHGATPGEARVVVFAGTARVRTYSGTSGSAENRRVTLVVW